MSKAKMMNWLKKVSKIVTTDCVEEAIMKKCGSERMMDDVVDEKINNVVAKTNSGLAVVKNKTTPIIKQTTNKVKPTINKIVEKTNVYMSAAKKKTNQCTSIIKDKMTKFQSTPVCTPVPVSTPVPSVPMCRVVPHVPAGDAPLSGMPVVDKQPGPMTIKARVQLATQRRISTIPMCICK